VKHFVELIARKPVSGTVVEVRSGTSTPFAIPANGRLRLAGNAEADYGYVLLGTVA
jgi:hypothetical protein